MHIVCEGLDLSEAILKVSKAISMKTTNPILEGIKVRASLNELVLSATDLELAIEKRIRADVKAEGETVVPGKFFTEFVKKINDNQIELVLNEKNQLKISYGENESQIQCFSPTEYPALKKIDSADFFAMTQQDLKAVIKKAIYAVAVDDSRPILKGCLLELTDDKIATVALDGYRLAKCEKPLVSNNLKNNLIVPARSLSEIANILQDNNEIVNVYVQKNHLMLDLNSTKVMTRLFEGEFLSYKQIIAKEFTTTIIINKKQFETSLERISLLSRIGQNNLVNLEIKNGTMHLTSNSEIGNIEEIINIGLEGKEMKIAFNARYFLEAMRVVENEFLKVNFNTSNNPCVITATDESTADFVFLILPVRMIN